MLTGHVTTSESGKSRLGWGWTVSLCPAEGPMLGVCPGCARLGGNKCLHICDRRSAEGQGARDTLQYD